MSDNVIDFPKGELNIEFTPEEEMAYDEVVMAVQSSMLFLCDGLERGSDATWEHIMDASINMAIAAGVKSGLDLEDMQLLFNILEIEKIEFDA